MQSLWINLFEFMQSIEMSIYWCFSIHTPTNLTNEQMNVGRGVGFYFLLNISKKLMLVNLCKPKVQLSAVHEY